MGEREERLRELGRRLRRLRADAGLTGAEVAALAGVAQPTVSKIETGRMLPGEEVVERLAAALNLDGETRDELAGLLARVQAETARRRREGLAVARQREIGDRERGAAVVRSFQCAVLPGLVQTTDYARAALAASRLLGDLDEQELDRAVAARVERQAVLYAQGRRFSFVLTEGALRTWPGSSASVMVAQLDRLSVLDSLGNVRVGVVPWDAVVPELPLHGFAVYDETTATLETFGGELAVTDEKEVRVYLDTFAAFEDAARYGEAMRNVLGRVVEDYRRLASSM